MNKNGRFWQQLIHHTEQKNLPWVSHSRKDSRTWFPFRCRFQTGILPTDYFDISFNWDGYKYGIWMGEANSGVYVPQYHWKYTYRLKNLLKITYHPQYGDMSFFVESAYRYYEFLLEEADKAA